GFGMPETDSSTRAISLNMLAPFGIQSVQVSKSPTPDMPGDSIADASIATGLMRRAACARCCPQWCRSMPSQPGSGRCGLQRATASPSKRTT
ncbi:hypothetical protein EIJ44_08205, partial [Xanthomonas perforans]